MITTLIVGVLFSLAFAIDVNTSSPNSSTCAPIYGWSLFSSRPAAVKLKLETIGTERAPFGYVIYNYEDDKSIGVTSPSDGTKSYFCTADNLDIEGCTTETIGKLLLKDKSVEAVTSGKWMEAETSAIGEFPVPSTGYYCVRVINPTGTALKISADFQNPYGNLPAEYRPLMNMSFWLAIIYLASLAGWTFLLLRHSRVLVSFQKYLGVMLGLSFLESLVFYIFYSWYNSTGSASVLLLSVAAVVGATRMTASLFILLIVSMGYGTVLPSLEDRAKPIYGLSLFYLAASVINVIASLTSRTSGQLVLLVSTVGVICGGAIYLTWTFDSLKTTIAILLQRKQYAKLEMYYKLTALLKALYTATILCMISSVLFVAGSSTSQSWYARNWNWLWFMTDGWQSILNLIACLGAAYIFRPRSNNRTYDMNELSSEPVDFDDEKDQDEETGRAGGVVDMKTFKKYETRQRAEEEKTAGHEDGGYARLEDPEWARPEDPFESDVRH